MDIASLHKMFLECTGVSTDSRTVLPGQLFVALKGDHFDGHQFVQEVLDKGAKYALISNAECASDKTVLVGDTLQALQKLSQRHRNYLDIPVIGITGSNGKTTTKELLTQVLKIKYEVHATHGNLNNHIGVPLTILGANSSTEMMIVEMGANHIGEIDFLCDLAKPDYGLITNIGHAHIEGFGSYEGVIQAKTELYKHLRKRSKLIFYNGSDTTLIQQLPNGVRAVPYLQNLSFGDKSFYLSVKQNSASHQTKLVGGYNKVNIRAALTVGNYFNIDMQEMIRTVCAYEPKNNRSQIVKKKETTLILDAYNANPSSMESSIQSLADTNTGADKMLILGDMKELGADSITMHKQVLSFAERFKWKGIILVGEHFNAADPKGKYLHFENVEALSKSQDEILTMAKNSVCLIKASRSLKLEKIEALFD